MITDLPPVPSRADPSTFSAKSDLFLGALDTFGTELNATKEDVNLSQTQASASKTSASTSATNANTSANNASTYAANALVNANAAAANTNAPLWISGTTYALGRLVYSAVTGRTYRRIVAGAGTTDPSSDAVNWTVLGLDINTSYPVLRPTLNLNFTSEAIDPRITFTRASTATRTNSKGLIETSEVNASRFDYDPTTLACKGLLIEESRTNLFTYSEQFDNAIWGKTSVSITANNATSPDGNLSMDKLIVSNTILSTSAYLSYSVTKAASAISYSLSFYAKASEKGGFRIYVRDSATSANFAIVTFNISTGVIQTAASTEGTFTSGSAPTPVDCGNGIYRCTLNFTSGTETTMSVRLFLLNADGTSFTGDGTSGIYLWGAQLEAGSFPTSYIPTTSSTVTRAADVAVMTGSNFSSWYRADEGSILCKVNVTSTTGGLVTFNDRTISNQVTLRFESNTARLIVLTSGSTVASISTGTPSSSIFKLVGTYKENDFAVTRDGSAVVTDTSGAIPSVSQMRIGSLNTGSIFLNGCVSSIAYYPKRLSNSELAQISTL